MIQDAWIANGCFFAQIYANSLKQSTATRGMDLQAGHIKVQEDLDTDQVSERIRDANGV